MGKRSQKNIGLAERAKRIETIRQSLREARDGVEVATAQIAYLGGDSLEAKQTRETIDAELDWLEQMSIGLMTDLVRRVSSTDAREVSQIVSDNIINQAEQILREHS